MLENFPVRALAVGLNPAPFFLQAGQLVDKLFHAQQETKGEFGHSFIGMGSAFGTVAKLVICRVNPRVEYPPLDGQEQSNWQHFVQGGLLIIFDDHSQGIAFVQYPQLMGGNAAAGSVVTVIDDSLRRKLDAIAQCPQPVAQVHILKVGEKVVVKTADFRVDFPLDAHTTATGKDQIHRVLIAQRRVRSAEIQLEAVASEVHPGSHKIHRMAVPTQNLRSGADQSGIWLHRCKQMAQPFRCHPHIVVQKDHIFAAGVTHPQVVASGKAKICGTAYHLHVGMIAFHVLHAGVCGAVVNQNQLHLAWIVSLGQTGETGVQVHQAVEVENNDAHTGPCGQIARLLQRVHRVVSWSRGRRAITKASKGASIWPMRRRVASSVRLETRPRSRKIVP